jgi:hypothetical protein
MKKIFVIITILVFSISSCSSYSKEDLENDVKASIMLENNDPNIIVDELNLIKTVGDNTYEGFVNTIENGEEFQYNITVVVDEDEFIWEVY